jgi:hypothetical protein
MTRIASVATHMISVPRPQPVWTAHEESKAWSVILTEVHEDGELTSPASTRRADDHASH